MRVPVGQLSKAEHARFDAVIAELRTGLEATSDDAGPHMILGMIDFRQGKIDAVRDEYWCWRSSCIATSCRPARGGCSWP